MQVFASGKRRFYSFIEFFEISREKQTASSLELIMIKTRDTSEHAVIRAYEPLQVKSVYQSLEAGC